MIGGPQNTAQSTGLTLEALRQARRRSKKVSSASIWKSLTSLIIAASLSFVVRF